MARATVRHVGVRSALVVFAALGLVGGALGGLVYVSGEPHRGYAAYAVFVAASTVGTACFGGVQAVVYNAVARRVGGLRVDLETGEGRSSSDDDRIVGDAVVRCTECHGLEDRDRDTCRFCGEPLEDE